MEAFHEIEGLNLLSGTPTVMLLKFSKKMNAMLLEKCIPGSYLNSFPETFQDETICELLKELWKADYTTENFRSLGELVS